MQGRHILGRKHYSEKRKLEKGKWEDLVYEIPALEAGCIDEIGFCFHVEGTHTQVFDFVGMIDDLYAEGKADYTIEFRKEKEEVWTGLHREISQCTKLKGLSYLEDGYLHLSCSDFGEMYTGRHDWEDYKAEFFITPLTGEHHFVNARVQGAIRSYAAGLLPNGQFGILKNDNGYETLKAVDYPWKPGEEYRIQIQVLGNKIEAEINGEKKVSVEDQEHIYWKGSIGISAAKGSHMKCRKIIVS